MYAYIDPVLWKNFYDEHLAGKNRGTLDAMQQFLREVGTKHLVNSLPSAPNVPPSGTINIAPQYWPVPNNAGLRIRFL